MVLEFLEFAVGGEPRVWIVEADNKTQGDHVLAKVVHERSTVCVFGKRVSHGVHHFALVELLRLDLPHLLDAKPIRLRLTVPPEVVFLHDLLRQAAMAALPKQCDTGMELHPALKRILGLAITADPKIIGRDALDRALRVVEDLARRKAGIHLDANLLGALRKPLAQLAQADDVVALVAHLRRVRDRDRVFLGQEAHLVGRRGRDVLEARRVVFREPVRDQLVQRGRLDHVPGDDVVANLAGLFEEEHAEVVISGLVGEFLQLDGRG